MRALYDVDTRGPAESGRSTRRGTLVQAQHVHKLLRNPAYTGLMVCRTWEAPSIVDFAPLITDDLFQQVQFALRAPETAPIHRQVSHHDFPLRRFVACGTCGSPLTGVWSRGKLGRRYACYNCRRHCEGQSVAKAALEDAFLEQVSLVLKVDLEAGVPSESKLEPTELSWAQSRAWLRRIRRFRDTGR